MTNQSPDSRRAARCLDIIQVLVVGLDQHARVNLVNREVCELLDCARHNVLGKSWFDEFVAEHARVEARDDFRSVLDGRVAPRATFEWTVLTREGAERTISWRHGRELGEDGRPIGALMSGLDITESRGLSDQLSFQKSHDELTGLVNRQEFERRLEGLLSEARAGDSTHVLCYMDLDQFKVINENCGHLVGDELLCQLARRLESRVRSSDTLARLGGDEFGILMAHCALDQGERVAMGLRRMVEEFRFAWGGQRYAVATSVGLVEITAFTQGTAAAMSAADNACYAAKDEGGNRVRLHRDEDTALAQRHGEMRWVARIHESIEEDRFRLHAQPIVSLHNGVDPPLHYEVLVRLQDQGDQVIAPGTFLPVAEKFNLAARLDRFIIGKAFHWLAQHPSHLARLELCSINVSGQTLGDGDASAYIIRLLEELALPADKIGFEITETAAIANLDAAVEFIGDLRAVGCRFALDDFGSGLSSFAYLKNLPVDFLKIDGVFVKAIIDDPIDAMIVRSISEIGHSMCKATIAEFVESEAVMTMLREIGVDYAQGFGIGRPRPIEEMA